MQETPPQAPTGALRNSTWAIALFGYTNKSRSAWWQFVKSNSIPYIRTGKQKIQFSEQAVLDWIAKRSTTGKAPSL